MRRTGTSHAALAYPAWVNLPLAILVAVVLKYARSRAVEGLSSCTR